MLNTYSVSCFDFSLESYSLSCCPFCESVDFAVYLWVSDSGVKRYSVCCLLCCCEGPFSDSPDAAVVMWNYR